MTKQTALETARAEHAIRRAAIVEKNLAAWEKIETGFGGLPMSMLTAQAERARA